VQNALNLSAAEYRRGSGPGASPSLARPLQREDHRKALCALGTGASGADGGRRDTGKDDPILNRTISVQSQTMPCNSMKKSSKMVEAGGVETFMRGENKHVIEKVSRSKR
jgi:hypothetical protein